MSSASCNTGCQSVAPFTDWLRCQSLPGPDGPIPPRQAGTALLHPWSGGGCTHTLVGPPHRIVDGVQIWLFSGHAAYRIRIATFLNEWYMWQYELHPPHLINVATLPCESQNTKNVVLQQDITKENCITYIIASSKWTRAIMCLKFTYLACMKHRRPVKMLDANFDRNVINAGMTIWDHVCMLMVDTLNACSDLNVHLYDSPEHFMKLSM